MRRCMDAALAANPEGAQLKRVQLEQVRLEYTEEYIQMRRKLAAGDYAAAIQACDAANAKYSEIKKMDRFHSLVGSPFNPTSDAAQSLSAWRKLIVNRYENTGGNGKPNDLVAKLPEMWKFSTDPERKAFADGWTAANYDDSGWKELSTALVWTYQWPGDYHDQAVYRTRVKIDDKWTGRKIELDAPEVYGEFTLFVNGSKVVHRDYKAPWWLNDYHKPWVADLTEFIKPGEVNQITLVVNQPISWGGVSQTMFLWSPKE